MLTPSPLIIQLLMTFSAAFTVPTWHNLQVLLYGAILAPGQRTVTAALRAVGLSEVIGTRFGKYHRALNRARWSPWCLSRLLLGLIVPSRLAASAPLVLLIDETIERRRGPRIRYLGWFRDAVRSTGKRVTFALGIRWCCVCVLAPVPWCRRPWALPFWVVPLLSAKCCAKLHKRFQGPVAWAQRVLLKVRQWQPERELVLVGDGTYAALDLIAQAQQMSAQGSRVRVVTGLRLDAGLYDFPPPMTPVLPGHHRKSGPKQKKGAAQAKLRTRLEDPHTRWQKITTAWYGGETKCLEMISGVSLWYKRGHAPVPVHWVLVRCPQDPHFKAAAYQCSDLTTTSRQILEWVIGRWNIEVTFEEARAHLGWETQRQWSQRAIERTTPCLLGLFSVVVLMACVLHPQREQLPVAHSSWYDKKEATFSDVIAAVRRHLWRAECWAVAEPCGDYASPPENSARSPHYDDWCLMPRSLLRSMQNLVCYGS
jgi:DDE superfamily endonuclease